MGAVMGSKNLKAVAVRGSTRYLDLTHDPQPIAELGIEWVADLLEK